MIASLIVWSVRTASVRIRTMTIVVAIVRVVCLATTGVRSTVCLVTTVNVKTKKASVLYAIPVNHAMIV